MRPREELSGRSPIAPGQARLTLEFLRDGLPEKKLQLVGTSILLILLSPEPGCYIKLGMFSLGSKIVMSRAYAGPGYKYQTPTTVKEQQSIKYTSYLLFRLWPPLGVGVE